jgi:hypothetical protein
MFLIEGIFLGYHISPTGVIVDSTKIKVIKNHPPLKSQKEVRSILEHVGFYHHFIENLVILHLLYFHYFIKIHNFFGLMNTNLLLNFLRNVYLMLLF